MTKAADDKKVENHSKKNTLGKISTVTKKVDLTDSDQNLNSDFIATEKSLIEVTRLLLREFGIRKSGAAIREAVDTPHEFIGPKEVVSAISNLGFKASFGNLKLKKLSNDFFPLIAFQENGEIRLVKSVTSEGVLSVFDHSGKLLNSTEMTTFEKEFSGYVIIVKELSEREKEERTGHWFFSAFRKSKWIYVQVMIAAMVSNFLSLTTSLFTMTVYDRIIPNGAFESLIALSIGVIIALGFDFLIKGIRAKFIDVASKRADLEISRRLFDRILTLTPTEQRQKNWRNGRYYS
jgi:ATP-binding cassette subfamily C protein LapB